MRDEQSEGDYENQNKYDLQKRQKRTENDEELSARNTLLDA